MSVEKKLDSEIEDTSDAFYLKYHMPFYNYLQYIETPGSLNVSREGNSILRNITAFPVWFNTLLLGLGNANTKEYKLGKGIYNTGGPLGNKYKLKSGTCPNNTYRWMTINNIPKGIPGGSPVNTRGLIPGIIESLIDINPVTLYLAMSGKSNKLGECFTLKPNNNKHNYIVFTLIICFFSIIYN